MHKKNKDGEWSFVRANDVCDSFVDELYYGNESLG